MMGVKLSSFTEGSGLFDVIRPTIILYSIVIGRVYIIAGYTVMYLVLPLARSSKRDTVKANSKKKKVLKYALFIFFMFCST